MIPTHIAAVCTQAGIEVPEKGCDGAKFHSPTPLVLNEYREWSLCGVCLDNVNVLLTLLAQAHGSLAWEVRREFGNEIRRIGMTVYERVMAEESTSG